MVRMPAPPPPKPDSRPLQGESFSPAAILFLAVSFAALIALGAWLGGGFIIETPEQHSARLHICARGYEI